MSSGLYDYVENRLKHWAEWSLRNAHKGLGYKSRSLQSNLGLGSAIHSSSTFGTKYPSFNDNADEIEKIVSELARQNFRLAAALRENYFGIGTIKTKAERVNSSSSQFKVHVEMAKYWIIGWFTAFEKFDRRSL